MTDDLLLTEFVSHHQGSAFEALVRRHGPMVLRVCRDILGDREDAEDAFQATFLVLLRQAGAIRERASVGRWLYEVACRVSRRERRRIAKIRYQERQVPEMDARAPLDFDPMDNEWKPILHDEIRHLPLKLRDPIVLCYFEGLTVEDAARRLSCPIGTLKSRLGRAREVLRSRLTRRGLAASVLLILMFSMTEEASAAVPEPLLDSTVRSGLAGLGTKLISRRVASMVVFEETARRRIRLITTWAILLFAVTVFGATRMVSIRPVQAAPAIIGPGPIVAPGSPSPVELPQRSRDRSEDHCQA